MAILATPQEEHMVIQAHTPQVDIPLAQTMLAQAQE